MDERSIAIEEQVGIVKSSVPGPFLTRSLMPMLTTMPNSRAKEPSVWVCALGTTTLFSTSHAKSFFVGS